MGQNASPEGRAELREQRTRFIGSVAYFPERYGDDLIRVGLELLNRRAGAPSSFRKAPTRHARERRLFLSQ